MSNQDIILKSKKGAGCGCRSITCGGCLLILFACGLITYLLIFQPAQIWPNLVNFLNDGSTIPSYTTQSSDTTKFEINEQVTNIGENSIVITEPQITSFIQDRFQMNQGMRIDIEIGSLTLFFPLYNSNLKEPLFIKLAFREIDEKLKLDEIGTPRFNLPKQLNEEIIKLIFKTLNLEYSDDLKAVFLKNFIPEIQDVEIKNIEFEQDELILQINFSPDIF